MTRGTWKARNAQILILAAACKTAAPSEPRPAPTPPGEPRTGSGNAPGSCAEFCQHQASCMPTIVNYNSCIALCEQQTANAPMMPRCFESFNAIHTCINKLSCDELKSQVGLTQPTLCVEQAKRFNLYCSQNVPAVSACLNDCDLRIKCGDALDLETCALTCTADLQQLSIAQGLDCWSATSMALICKSTLSCRERKDAESGQATRCTDRAQEQAAKCPRPR